MCAIAIAVAFHGGTYACDVCGCGGNSQYLGMLPQYQYRFIGIQQQYSEYFTRYPGIKLTDPYQQGHNQYYSMQVWGRYNIGRNYQVYAFVPYHYNVYNGDNPRYTSSGVGDVSALLSRAILNNAGGAVKHSLLLGAGIKAPTGKYTGIDALERLGLPNMQPGTGSWDGLLSSNYTVQLKKLGINADASYTLTTAGPDGHKYGNKLTSGVLCFYAIGERQFILLPQAGMRYEYALKDYDNYDKRWLNDESGGYVTYAMVAAQAYYKRVGLRLGCQLPIAQHYSSGYVVAKQKIETGLFLLF